MVVYPASMLRSRSHVAQKGTAGDHVSDRGLETTGAAETMGARIISS